MKIHQLRSAKFEKSTNREVLDPKTHQICYRLQLADFKKKHFAFVGIFFFGGIALHLQSRLRSPQTIKYKVSLVPGIAMK